MTDNNSSLDTPVPTRVRNILTLEERVRAIQAYECRPMYTKVAHMFNCSWEQIKNIIANKDAIMGFYAATKDSKKQFDQDDDARRHQKIAFLGECIYEYIQRIQFHSRADITENLIRSKAYDFQDIMKITNFVPNKAWINHLKATYNFSLSNRQIVLTRTPPSSLDPKDIMTYCTKHKAKTDGNNGAVARQMIERNLYRAATKIAISCENDATLEELRIRRKRKIDYLERALMEYIQRYKLYSENAQLTEEILRNTACDLTCMLKIENFNPNKTWFNHFMASRQVNLMQQTDIRRNQISRPSLNLKDILSDCVRKQSQVESSFQRTPNTNTTDSRANLPILPALVPISNTRNDISLETHSLVSKITNNALVSTIKEENIDIEDTRIVESEHPAKEQVEEFDQEDVKPDLSELDKNMEAPNLDSAEVDDDKLIPTNVRSYSDALKLLKPIEEFAMLEENYRAIGLISQLEDIFKNPPKRKRIY